MIHNLSVDTRTFSEKKPLQSLIFYLLGIRWSIYVYMARTQLLHVATLPTDVLWYSLGFSLLAVVAIIVVLLLLLLVCAYKRCQSRDKEEVRDIQWNPPTLWGPGEVSCVERCPHFRGRLLLLLHTYTQIDCLVVTLAPCCRFWQLNAPVNSHAAEPDIPGRLTTQSLSCSLPRLYTQPILYCNISSDF